MRFRGFNRSDEDLRRTFKNSKLLRQAVRGIMLDEGARLRDLSLYTAVLGEILQTMPEPFIKQLLYAGIADPTISAEERNEAWQLLQLTTTTLTKKQRRQMILSLTAD